MRTVPSHASYSNAAAGEMTGDAADRLPAVAARRFPVTHLARLPAETTGAGVAHFVPFCFDNMCFVSFCFCMDVTLRSETPVETRAMARARLRCPRGSKAACWRWSALRPSSCRAAATINSIPRASRCSSICFQGFHFPLQLLPFL
jgi:hypothetical protein